MTKRSRILVAAAALSLAGASPAFADLALNSTPFTYCGGSNFGTCATVSLEITGTSVKITITNPGGSAGGAGYGDALFTSVGLSNLPAGTAIDGSSLVVTQNGSDVTSGWKVGAPNLSGDGIIQQTTGVRAASPGVDVNGIAVGETLVFEFDLDFTGNPPSNWASNAGVAIHATRGPGGCSTKINVGANGTTSVSSSFDPACVSTVPEPATMGLLATGLAGMGGMGLLRRRRKQG